MVKWEVSFETRGMLPSARQVMPEILRQVAEAVRREWINAARTRLHTSARRYIAAIGEPEIGRSAAVIRLRGDQDWLPNALEEGKAPYDMKPGLLRSKKAKRDKRGRPYIHVPFRLKTPGSQVTGPSPPVMPRPIYRLALRSQFGQSVNITKKYNNYAIRTRLSPDLKRWGHYTWKASPFAGVTKVRRFPGELATSHAGGMAAYMTFRTVSRRSDPSSWIHPGLRPHNIMDVAAEKLKEIFPRIVEEVWTGV